MQGQHQGRMSLAFRMTINKNNMVGEGRKGASGRRRGRQRFCQVVLVGYNEELRFYPKFNINY